MLNKLIKYEIKATARIFIPIYLGLIVFSIISKVINLMPNEGINSLNIRSLTGVISMVLFYTLIIGIQVMTIVVLIQRFYKNLLGDEGYLMFTLPAEEWKHIISKLIAAMVWVVLSAISAVISIALIIPGEVFTQVIKELPVVVDQAFNYFGSSTYIFGIEAIVICILTIASSILMVYGAIALGQLFNKYKLLASFGMYIGLRTIEQFIRVILVIVLGNSLFKEFSTIPSTSQMQLILVPILIYTIISTVAYFLLTKFILKNKLNLE